MRRHTLIVLALAGLAAACGDTQDDREATGALSGAAMGAIVGGPIGAIIGAGAGYVAGNKLDKSADEKIEEVVNLPMGPTTPEGSSEPKPPEPSGASERSKTLTQAEIEERLHTAGYKPVHAIHREGPAYVARGERNGTLYDVRVEAATGQLLASREVGIVRDAPAAVLTEQQIRTTLRQSGYEMVGNVARDGDRYRAEAMQDGRMYDVVVDGRTGQIVTSTPSAATGAPAPAQGG
jgi:hypothetical protein